MSSVACASCGEGVSATEAVYSSDGEQICPKCELSGKMLSNEQHNAEKGTRPDPMWGVLSIAAGVACIAVGIPKATRAHDFGYYDEVVASALLTLAGVLLLAGGVRKFLPRR